MARKKVFELGLPGELVVQERLFSGAILPANLDIVPRNETSPRDTLDIILNTHDEDYGADFEFNIHTKKPSIMGIATSKRMSGIRHDDNITRQLIERCIKTGQKIIGHSVLGAERPILEKIWGKKIPLDVFEDSMLSNFLCNQVLAKAPGKEEDQDGGSLGFNDLWSATSLVLAIQNWKSCRGLDCSGPCPKHDPFGYCAQDSWASPQIFKANLAKFRERGLPYSLYRKFMELGEIGQEMEERGLRVDRKFVAELDASLDEKKEKLFKKNEDGNFIEFNPKSPAQALEWFSKNNINIDKADKETILKTLKKEAAKYGFKNPDTKELLEELSSAEGIPSSLEVLYRYYDFKDKGKGCSPWMADKYFGPDNLLHPRMVLTGASSARVSFARPNSSNFPSRGAMANIKYAIIPLDDDYDIAKSDACVAPGTKVLTTDLRWVNAEDLKEGDSLIAFPEKFSQKDHKFEESIVTGTGIVNRPRFRIKTTRGEIIASDLHPIVVRRKKTVGGGKVKQWVLTKDLKVGDSLPFTAEPWFYENDYVTGWLGGILDGEGWVSGPHVGFGQQTGSPVIKQFLEYVYEKNINFGGGYGKDKNTECRGVICKPVEKWTSTGIWNGMKILGITRPIRLLSKAHCLWEGRRTWGKNNPPAEITEIEYLGEGPVVCLSTSTRTYISNGFYSHNSNLEFRKIAYQMGVDPRDGVGKDPFTDVVERTGNQLHDVAKEINNGWDARDIAKRINHASSLLEGLKLLSPADLMKPSVKKMIEVGALRVYHPKYNSECQKEWTFEGNVVAFSGVNVAEKLFGSATYENRKKALAIQEDIIGKGFPFVRQWQKKILDEWQGKPYVRSLTGRFLDLYDKPEDNAKIIVTFFMQGCSADHMQAQVRKLKYLHNNVPYLFIHDEISVCVPKVWSDKKVLEYLEFMGTDTDLFPGFNCPAKVGRGPTWGHANEKKNVIGSV